MKRVVCNIPRIAAREGYEGRKGDKQFIDNAIWISISEPDDQRSIVSSALDQLPNIKLAFWDLTTVIPDFKGKTLYPPGENEARKIVNFLLKHKEKNFVIVNCAAGVSRSGAVAQFCSEFLDYEWDPFCKSCAAPNSVLYRLMVDYYQFLQENENIKYNQTLE